jgi:hypothetical protein
MRNKFVFNYFKNKLANCLKNVFRTIDSIFIERIFALEIANIGYDCKLKRHIEFQINFIIF